MNETNLTFKENFEDLFGGNSGGIEIVVKDIFEGFAFALCLYFCKVRTDLPSPNGDTKVYVGFKNINQIDKAFNQDIFTCYLFNKRAKKWNIPFEKEKYHKLFLEDFYKFLIKHFPFISHISETEFCEKYNYLLKPKKDGLLRKQHGFIKKYGKKYDLIPKYNINKYGFLELYPEIKERLDNFSIKTIIETSPIIERKIMLCFDKLAIKLNKEFGMSLTAEMIYDLLMQEELKL